MKRSRHRQDHFRETVANIRRAVSAGLRVNTSTVITRQNYAEMPEVIALSQALGAGQAVFNRYIGAALPASKPPDKFKRQSRRWNTRATTAARAA